MVIGMVDGFRMRDNKNFKIVKRKYGRDGGPSEERNGTSVSYIYWPECIIISARTAHPF